ncbi:hypothetical protein HMPREF9296_0418 [Prevotella disiens FB035-09AN]|uniref:Uncharacterized protein n=2 Tax=Prevotella disiens TaxID=28130 RepID=E1KQ11_9BACT|nr:hypothetical protein HMPREF9296_0418 [Prevotella disiens FB035-09AN]
MTHRKMKYTFFDKIYFCGEIDGSLTDGVAAITFPIAFALSIPLFRIGEVWALLPIALIWFAMFRLVEYIYDKHGRRGKVLIHFRGSKYDARKFAYPLLLSYWIVLPALSYVAQHVFLK